MKRVISWVLLGTVIAFADRAIAQIWSQTGAPVGSWAAVASSADGTKLAGVLGTHIYTSTNAGAAWSTTSAPLKNWTAVASSSDGSVLLAVAPSGGIYTSTNSGSTWQSNTVPANPYADWDAAAISADGNTLIAGGQISGPVAYSTNRGATWRTNGVPGGYWTSVVCSGDGSKLAAVWGGTIYVSTNSGVTWTNYNATGNLASCSADGSRLLLSTSSIYLSTNWGATFTLITLPYVNANLLTAGSADGRRLLGLLGGNLYLSTNYGTSWTTNYAPSQTWNGVAMCPSGTKMFAASTSGIYVWQPPVLNMSNTPGNAVFSWSTNGTPFRLQRTSALKTTNWVSVTNTPIITNSLNQVTLSKSNSAGFFRLISQ